MTRKTAGRLLWIFTFVVYALVIVLHELPGPESSPSWTIYQPKLNAIINGSCFLILIFSFIAIKNRAVGLHQNLNTAAMFLSLIFLLNYVLYHSLSGDTAYGGENKSLYYFILLSHIFLAGISLPMILFSWLRGFYGDVAGHKKLVRFTYPIWLYVTLTGVLVYLFLSPYYG
jgi:putative membrane protein